MDAWDELLRQSLLGTARVAEDLPALPEALDGLLRAVELPAEERLLHAAILLDRYRRLGSLPAPAPSEISTAPPEHLPATSDELAALLRGLLEEDEPLLLAELLRGMAAIPCLAPPDTLPALLDLITQRAELRGPALACGGERLRWLAHQHREWSALVNGAGDDPWLTGDTATRVALLRDGRQRDPAAARERLAAGFGQEAPRERLAFLESLETGLSPADIAFLESCLADRSQPVRLLATRYLVRLGGNPTADTVLGAVAGMMSIHGKLRRQLQIQLPESFEKDWSRFGLREKPGGGEHMGQRAFWLTQWVGLVGPTRLAGLLEVDTGRLETLVGRSDFAKELTASLEESAVVLADTGYADWRLVGAKPEAFINRFPRLGMVLPPSRRDEMLREFLHRQLPRLEPTALLTLVTAVGELSSATTREVVAQFPALCAVLAKHPWQGRSLAQLAHHLAPGEATALEAHCLAQAGLAGVNEFWRRYERRCRIQQALARRVVC